MKYMLSMIAIVILVSKLSFAQGFAGRSTWGFRSGFWDLANEKNVNRTLFDEVSGGFSQGSGMDYYYWISDAFAWGLSTSGLNKEIKQTFVEGSVTRIFPPSRISISPITLGLRYHLFQNSGIPVRPYLNTGGGIYRGDGENKLEPVSINTKGGYLGSGADIVLFKKGLLGIKAIERSWFGQSWLGTIFGTGFALNIDYRYHFIRFNQELASQKNYDGSELTFGFKFILGRGRSGIRVKYVELITTDIYPAYSRMYADFPIGWITVENTSGNPIDVKVYLSIEDYMNRPSETDYIEIPAKQTKRIPVTAVFSDKIAYLEKAKPTTANFMIETKTLEQFQYRKTTKFVIHSRNGWNGDVDKLRFFMTSDDHKVIGFSRQAVMRGWEDMETTEMQHISRARIIFDELSKLGIRYEHDPNLPYYESDFVQYPFETLERKSGDCDDLTVLYASLLESLGINTAFVDVRNVDKPNEAHIYMMFDTGVVPENAGIVSSNEKKYVVRTSQYGQRSIWIPVETTLIQHGFNAAWEAGALAYLREGEIEGGLMNGWVEIVDVKQ